MEESPANLKKLPWKHGRIDLKAPFNHQYGAQIPSEYFDDALHRIEVFVQSPDGSEVRLLQDDVILAGEHAGVARHEVERIKEGRPDTFFNWVEDLSVRRGTRLKELSFTESYASVTVTGPVGHQRVDLRLGDAIAVLHAVNDGDSDGETTGEHRFAGELPTKAHVPEQLRLYSSGAELSETFDLRLGGETGRRPQDLPDEIEQSLHGEFYRSDAEFDGVAFHGWAFHTGALQYPARVVLESIVDGVPRELIGTDARARHPESIAKFGVKRSGYSMVLPPEALVTGEKHLRLTVAHGSIEEILWEDDSFDPSDEMLLEMARKSLDPDAVIEMWKNARRAGRETFYREFMRTHHKAKSEISLKRLERAVASLYELPGATLNPASGAIWYWVEEVRTNTGRIHWFTQNAIRNRNGGARDILAYAATKGRYDFDQLHGVLESYRIKLFRDQARDNLQADNWKTGMLSLARYLFAAPRDDIDYLDALTLYSMVEDWRGIAEVTGPNRSFYGELLHWRGEFDESYRLLTSGDPDPEHDYSQRLMALNALNPHVGDARHGRDTWLVEFNQLMEQGGAAGIELDDDVSFFSVSSSLPPAEDAGNGPLVTVLMPIYEPSAATDVAVRSLLAQTWTNIEILLMDDCSPLIDAEGNPAPYRDQLEALAALDDRIRLIFNETNRGSYSVRNDGIDLSRGELITIADKDDWHHPQQIELQVRDFMDHPDRVANMTNWVRVDEHLTMKLRSATGKVFYPSLPSVMFRRDPVVNDLGYWDTVRKSGDSEYKSRIENYYGIKIEPIIDAPLAFALMEGGNLTRDDLGVGYLAPERRAYLRAYKSWHRSIREEEASPYLAKSPQDRPFVAPEAYLPSRSKEPGKYDVVFASEFGFLAGNSTSLFNEINVCLSAGLRVGVIPLQNGLIPSAAKRQFNRKIDDLVFNGQIDRLSLDAVNETDLLVIRWPTAVQSVPDGRSGLIPGRIVIVANHPPYEPSGERRSYDMGTVTRNVEGLFGVRPVWAPQSEQISAMVEPLMPSSDLSGLTWKGIISLKDGIDRNRFHPGQPVIGRHARDDEGKWPSRREIFQKVYPIDGSAQVCILGGTKVPTQKGFMPRRPKNWEIYVFNEIDVNEYLDEKIDFFVYFHSDGWLEAFGMAILEAMSHGVVCVLPEHFRPVFKDGAVYAEPDQVQDVIAEFWDEGRYAEQQRRGRAFIEDECTSEAYLRRLARLGVTS
ncbi:glycosyltransferase [Citricoccus muralis]|uniref:Glycosyltransferase n=1 Tax=Citricoccus muralis TaxID=169134 RepID=A0ABY8H7S7_9MICC|nr:glycosyltransferase [Citricoccus muralis]WFP16713.1 glycosyltransferase [Citricoccus muralis]